eukprot:TRINITY_DN11431_c1_g2_i2.p3 TRINITY_DN11431_c1_g2~~TRINITY_DN11431_c1_g2_i2.p3  ORF type:complete len:104 (-),score=27.50 TRINITY_DN11431_c1_g2_i2:333-599(-)
MEAVLDEIISVDIVAKNRQEQAEIEQEIQYACINHDELQQQLQQQQQQQQQQEQLSGVNSQFVESQDVQNKDDEDSFYKMDYIDLGDC